MEAETRQRVGIVAECVCDLPRDVLMRHNIEVLYFLIETDTGVFADTSEITAKNILRYMRGGGKRARSVPPAPEVYREAFQRRLETCDEVILVAIGSGVSASCSHAAKAVAMMGEQGKRVHIFDSGHLSTGLGLLVIHANQMAEQGAAAEEILAALSDMQQRVSTSFIAENADFLYRQGRVSRRVMQLCHVFHIHPVLAMQNGRLKLRSLHVGQYQRAFRRYLRAELRHPERIDKRRAFLTYAGCSVSMLTQAREIINSACPFEILRETSASATVSANCGSNTLGILYIRLPEGGEK